MTALGRLVAARIAETGPISIAEYMSWCLSHPQYGYYMRGDPLGATGDFITAPEISQMFGELIGGWLVAAWEQAGRPAQFVLAELGPGRGTLMADALRVAARLPDFIAAADLWLVETSPALRSVQAKTLAAHRPRWADRVEALPAAPLLLVANEFFDALPVCQFQRIDTLWRERRVGLADDALAFVWAAPQAAPSLDAQFPGRAGRRAGGDQSARPGDRGRPRGADRVAWWRSTHRRLRRGRRHRRHISGRGGSRIC